MINDLSIPEQDDLAGNGFDIRNNMGGYQDDLISGNIAYIFTYSYTLPGIQSGCWFVQDNQSGIARIAWATRIRCFMPPE